MAQKSDGFEVFASAVDIGGPLALTTAVIAIEHRGNGIDAQTVDVKMLKPVQRASDQEALHFAAAEIVDVSIPIPMIPLERIEMFEQRSAIEARQSVRIGGEVRRHPVENDADTGGVQRLDETYQPLGRSELAARSEKAQRLIAPRSAEREFGDRQQFEVREMHFDQIGDE